MNSNLPTLSIIFYALLALFAFYVPLQAYARRVEKKLAQQGSSISNRHKSILVAYLIWYIPSLAVLVVGTVSTSFWVVIVTLVISIGWIWAGHSYIEAK